MAFGWRSAAAIKLLSSVRALAPEVCWFHHLLYGHNRSRHSAAPSLRHRPRAQRGSLPRRLPPVPHRPDRRHFRNHRGRRPLHRPHPRNRHFIPRSARHRSRVAPRRLDRQEQRRHRRSPGRPRRMAAVHRRRHRPPPGIFGRRVKGSPGRWCGTTFLFAGADRRHLLGNGDPARRLRRTGPAIFSFESQRSGFHSRGRQRPVHSHSPRRL